MFKKKKKKLLKITFQHWSKVNIFLKMVNSAYPHSFYFYLRLTEIHSYCGKYFQPRIFYVMWQNKEEHKNTHIKKQEWTCAYFFLLAGKWHILWGGSIIPLSDMIRFVYIKSILNILAKTEICLWAVFFNTLYFKI